MTEQTKYPPESHGLGSWNDGKSRIGFVNEVNGSGALEEPAFVPTRHELAQIVKYWATTATEVEFGWFITTTFGSSETRLHAFAWARIARVAQTLGTGVTKNLARDAVAEYGKRVDPRAWRIFHNGSKEEQEAFQDELQKAFSGGAVDDGSPLTPEELAKMDVEEAE